MNTVNRGISFSVAPILVWATMDLGALAASASEGPRLRITRGKDAPNRKRSKAAKPVVVSKPVWNQKAGFGLPVPPGWTGRAEGSKIILASPQSDGKQAVITMGPEPTELEASEYLAKVCEDLSKEKQVLPIVQRPIEFLDTTIYVALYPDSQGKPPGFGAVLLMDRPGDHVFVIRVHTSDPSLMEDKVVLASLGMLRFRNEPLPNFGQLIGLGKKKKRLKLGEIKVRPGRGTLAELRLPQVIRDKARQMKLTGQLHRYRIGIATPKNYDHNRVWPVLIVEAPATEESIARYQGLADAMGLVVLTVAPQSRDTTWPAEVQAGIRFCALNILCTEMALDRSRVYLLGSGAAGKRAQAVGAALPLARGVICHAATEDGLTGVLSKRPEAKTRLALAVAYSTSSKAVDPAQADALVAAWKKAGVRAARAFKGSSSRQAVRQAVKWLLKRDSDVIEADLAKLMARADKLAKVKSGEALTIYRRIVSSGLKNAQVDRAAKAVTDLLAQCRAVSAQLTTQPDEVKAERVIAQFKVAQRFQGTPEGSRLMRLLDKQLEYQ